MLDHIYYTYGVVNLPAKEHTVAKTDAAPEAAEAEVKEPVDRKAIWTDEKRKELSETLSAKYASGELVSPMKGKTLSDDTKNTIRVKALERSLASAETALADHTPGKDEDSQKEHARLEKVVETRRTKLSEA